MLNNRKEVNNWEVWKVLEKQGTARLQELACTRVTFSPERQNACLHVFFIRNLAQGLVPKVS